MDTISTSKYQINHMDDQNGETQKQSEVLSIQVKLLTKRFILRINNSIIHINIPNHSILNSQ